ncbi:D amino acid oxidase (DAO) family protein [Pasteurellaceae bacterium Pebbles2]|nr:D amino acid oxidase (DAO) family protein [Pasteurellaceae bacterium Pebbles2]
MDNNVQAIIIGGGFYGVNIALYLVEKKGFTDVVLIERENRLLSRASYVNQARVHNGYHYPRSFTTAYRSRINFPRFVNDWESAVKSDFTKLYAIARNNSKVTAKQFSLFCKEIGAEIEKVPSNYQGLFNQRLIEQAFLVKEYAFDSSILEKWALEKLNHSPITVLYDTEVKEINYHDGLEIVYKTKNSGMQDKIKAKFVFNCTYSGLNQYQGDFKKFGLQAKLKHEITEMGLVEMPETLKNVGITLMDGAFFSMMPFPARKLHTLSHVRYTPHFNWLDENGKQGYQVLQEYHKQSRVNRMIRDVARYIPAIADAQHRDSLFEVKTVLMKNEGDDGRPILFEKSETMPGLYSVLGGKIDNIYDIFERLENEI